MCITVPNSITVSLGLNTFIDLPASSTLIQMEFKRHGKRYAQIYMYMYQHNNISNMQNKDPQTHPYIHI